MPDCIGIPNSNEDEMHEKGNWKARLIVSEWKSGLEEVVSDCKCTGEGLDGASANSQRHQNCPYYHLLTRGTRIIFVDHLPVGVDGVAGKIIIFQ